MEVYQTCLQFKCKHNDDDSFSPVASAIKADVTENCSNFGFKLGEKKSHE